MAKSIKVSEVRELDVVALRCIVPITDWARGIKQVVKEAETRGLFPTTITLTHLDEKDPETEIDVTLWGA